METERVKTLQRQICAWIDAAGEGAKYFLELHSEGCIVGRNALMGLPEEYRQRVIVYAYAPGAYIEDKYASQITHYRSQRDFVPYFDFIGKIKCRHSTVVLKPHPDAPRLDHTINSPTFSRIRQENVNAYCSEYGGITCIQPAR